MMRDHERERSLKSSQVKYLKSLGHHLKPDVLIGKNGLTDEVLAEIHHLLELRELIKVRFLEYKDRKKEWCVQIEETAGCEWISMVGHVAIFYRMNPDPGKRSIMIPD